MAGNECLAFLSQVSIHTDEADFAALFLYRKLAKEPIEEHVLMTGPEVGATADEMKVALASAHVHISCKPSAGCI